MGEAQEYKCPACGGGLVYGANSGDMVCEFCDSHFTLQQLEDIKSAEEEAASAENSIGWDEYRQTEESGDFAALICPSCGAEIVTDETTAATECVYCGNPAVIRKKLSGIFKPDWVIPFKTTKKQAVDALKKLYRGKKLLPDAFTQDNRVEKVAGMYVPYWLYDCDASAHMTYNASRVSVYSDAKFNYTRTDKYLITRSGNARFSRIPVDGSTKLDNRYTEAIEPYDYSELVDFRDMYLSGYMADRYDVEAKDCNPRADERVRQSMADEFARTIQGYSSVTLKSANVSNSNGKVHYALMPVWMLNTKYKDKTYTFAMNGQTGKMIGELPVDRGKAFKQFLLWGGICSLAASAAALLTMLI
ncbi:MAG: hypothetical protein PUA83_04305 [Clostridiales bacterium]|nr:hypothetical protein [Clostridiales bacterium]